MKHKTFWMYFLFGLVIGSVVGLLKSEFAIWLCVGCILGFLVAILIETKLENIATEKIMWFGVILLFPIIFFKGYLQDTFWYDVFGILAVIGAFVVIVNFVKMLRQGTPKKKAPKKKR